MPFLSRGPVPRRPLALSARATLIALVVGAAAAVGRPPPDPIRVEGPELKQLDVRLPNGGLKPAAGVRNVEVLHASREHPDRADGKGWTYHHHPDLGCWKGRLYVAWNSCERDEDMWPSRELYSTSADGQTWSRPAELFPQGVSVSLRMYFFHAPNGRMLALAGLRADRGKASERTKGPLVVREIRPDGSLGPVYTLRPPDGAAPPVTPPAYRASGDAGLVEACGQLLANRLFLEQQDYGTLLGDRRMKWHDVKQWTHADAELARYAGDFGKAMCFFRRKDGAVVGVGKKGFVTVSPDGGDSWSPPTRPGSLVTGGGKVWGQRTPDGRYALVYNPHRDDRFPLVVVTGDDGVTFGGMRVLYGDKAPPRYPGANKDPGPQYVRGLSEWSDDGSWKDPALWVVYSVNKEDIWVSRVPVPIGGGRE